MKFSTTLLLLGFFCCLACSTPQQSKQAAPVLQQFGFSDLDSLRTVQPRPLAIFLHAKWCQFCRNMEQTTFKNKTVVDLLNDNYYFVSFDGEQKEDIQFRKNNFAFIPSGRNSGTHELAKALGTIDGQLVYPTFVILNLNDEIIFQHNSYLDDQSLEKVLGEGIKN